MPRSYSSETRAERSRQTRTLLANAARELFIADGWMATTMAGVASRAGVTRQTVYARFESKLALLDFCVDESLRGDDRGGSIRDRAAYQLIGEGDRAARIAAAATWLRGTHERSAAIQRVLDQASVTDPVAAAHLEVREANRWQEYHFALTLILDGSDPPEDLVDELWAIGSRDIWHKLVVQRGWNPDRWEAWFAPSLASAIERANV